MLAYSNRFVVLARLIRDMHAEHSRQTGEPRQRIPQQIAILRRRLRLVQAMQALGVLSFLFCTVSMLLLFLDSPAPGQVLFGSAVVCLMLSLGFSLWEVLISTRALDMVLDEFDGDDTP